MDALVVAKPNESARFDVGLGVVTHVPHWIGLNGSPVAYEPYVREMRIWADLFSRVEICAPFAEGPIKGNQAPYRRRNIVWHPISYTGSDGPKARLSRLLQLPTLALDIKRLIERSELVHLRGAGHPALVGNILVRLMRKPSITKYAGLFDSYKGERLPARLERWLLRLPGKRHCVLIYGPSDRDHLLSFLPALMSQEELVRAKELSSRKNGHLPCRLLSVGSLIPVKGFDLAIQGLGELRRIRPELQWEFTLVGDGPALKDLRELAVQCGIGDRVQFAGALPFAEVQGHYSRAHILIMPGVKEGWPKTIAEAWAHGAVPVAASAGLVPWILKENAGVLSPPTPEGLAKSLAGLLDDPQRMKSMSVRLIHRAAELSLESFRTRLEKVLISHCGLVPSSR